MRKRLLSIILSVAVALTMMPGVTGISFAGEANPTVPVELVKAQTYGTNAVKLSWNKVSGATKYVVYGQKCGKSYNKLKTTSSTSYVVKKIKGKKLKAHKNYKFYVTAYSGNKKLVSSKTIHFITAKTKGKYANASGITAKYSSKTLAPGQTLQLGATVKIYKNKKHLPKSHGAKLRYTSNNPGVASVNANGVVTAKSEGTAKIYIQDTGGLYVTTAITVKKPAPTEDFAVTFNMHGHGTAPANQTVKKGSKATEPESDPSEEGYTFGGWYTDDKYGTEFDFGKEITEDTTIHAKWTKNKTNIEKPIAEYGLVYNGKEQIGVASGEGYTLENSKATDAGEYTAIATLKDGYCWTDETTDPVNIAWTIARSDSSYAAPTAVTGLIYDGQEQVIANEGSTSDGTLYYAVTTEEGATIDDDEWKESIDKKINAGKYYVHYYVKGDKNHNDSDEGVIETRIGQAVLSCTVTFDLNGITGTAPTAQTVESGGKVTEPTAPTAEGYEFGGWFKEAACTNAWSFDSDTVTEDTTLYAKWTPVYQYTLTNDGKGRWEDEEGQIVSSITVLGEDVPGPGETITYIGTEGAQHTVTATANEGYEFDKCTYGPVPKTFNAVFKVKSQDLVRINFDTGEYRYYPVFDSVPEGVHFYSSDGAAEYSKMDANIAYAMVPEGTIIKTLRFINNISWNDVFECRPDEVYPYRAEVQDTFKEQYLIGGDEANEQVFRFEGDISGTAPLYNGVSLTDIWSVYNPDKAATGFGGEDGAVWSNTAYSPIIAFCWFSSRSMWKNDNRDNNNRTGIYISREFIAEASE